MGAGSVWGSAAGSLLQRAFPSAELATSPSSRAAVDPARGLLRKCPAPPPTPQHLGQWLAISSPQPVLVGETNSPWVPASLLLRIVPVRKEAVFSSLSLEEVKSRKVTRKVTPPGAFLSLPPYRLPPSCTYSTETPAAGKRALRDRARAWRGQRALAPAWPQWCQKFYLGRAWGCAVAGCAHGCAHRAAGGLELRGKGLKASWGPPQTCSSLEGKPPPWTPGQAASFQEERR